METNIQVGIRVRPMIAREIEEGLVPVWETNGKQIKSMEKQYIFDEVFNSQTNTKQIYDVLAKPLVQKAMEGVNGTMFAYGQTASGKTHTILGDDNEPGILLMAIADVFKHTCHQPDREFLLRVSYIEIYKEEITDLLSDKKEHIKILTNSDNELIIENLTTHTVTSYESTIELVERGMRNRRIEMTNMNERSSRSHTIFRLAIESRQLSEDFNTTGEDTAIIASELNMVDLAGSERNSQTGAQGLRMKEANSINLSLMTLGSVIRKLAEENNVHIPYRDSKLTRILQKSLGGNARTTIICTVSPVILEETDQTLNFAGRAKQVRNKPMINKVLDDKSMLRKQMNEIKSLKKKIHQLESGVNQTTVNDMKLLEKQMIDRQKLCEEQQQQIAKLVKEIVCTGRTMEKKKNRRITWCPGSLGKSHQFEDEPSRASSQLHYITAHNLTTSKISNENKDLNDSFERNEYTLLQEEFKDFQARTCTPNEYKELMTTLANTEYELEVAKNRFQDLKASSQSHDNFFQLQSVNASLVKDNEKLSSRANKLMQECEANKSASIELNKAFVGLQSKQEHMVDRHLLEQLKVELNAKLADEKIFWQEKVSTLEEEKLNCERLSEDSEHKHNTILREYEEKFESLQSQLNAVSNNQSDKEDLISDKLSQLQGELAKEKEQFELVYRELKDKYDESMLSNEELKSLLQSEQEKYASNVEELQRKLDEGGDLNIDKSEELKVLLCNKEEEFKKAHEDLKSNHICEVEKLQEVIEELKQSADVSKESACKIDKLKEENTLWQEKVSVLEEEKLNCERLSKDSEHKYNTILREYEEKFELLQSQLDIHSNNKEDLISDKLSQLQGELSKEKEQFELVYRELKDKYDESMLSNEELKSLLQSEQEKYASNIEELQRKLDEGGNLNIDKSEELKVLLCNKEEEFKKAHEDLKSNHICEVEKLQEVIEELKQSADVSKESACEIDKLKDENTLWQEKVSVLEEEKLNCERLSEDSEHKYNTILEEYKEKVESLQSQLNAVSNNQSDKEDLISDKLSQLQGELAKEKEQFELVYRELKDKYDESMLSNEELKSLLQSEQEKYASNIEELQRKLDEGGNLNIDKSEELKVLLCNKEEEFKKAHEDLKSNHICEVEKLQEVVEKLKQSADVSKESACEIDKLKEEHALWQEKVSVLEEEKLNCERLSEDSEHKHNTILREYKEKVESLQSQLNAVSNNQSDKEVLLANHVSELQKQLSKEQEQSELVYIKLKEKYEESRLAHANLKVFLEAEQAMHSERCGALERELINEIELKKEHCALSEKKKLLLCNKEEEFKKALEELKSNHISEVGKLQETIEELKPKNLISENKVLKETLVKLKSDCERKCELSKKAYQRKCEDVDTSTENLMQCLKKLTNENKILHAEFSQLQGELSKEKEQFELVYRELKDKYDESMLSNEELKSLLQSEQKKYASNIEELQRKLDEGGNLNIDKSEELKVLLCNKEEEFKKALEELKSNHICEVEKLQEVVQKLKQTAAVSKESACEIGKLKDRIKQLEHSVEIKKENIMVYQRDIQEQIDKTNALKKKNEKYSNGVRQLCKQLDGVCQTGGSRTIEDWERLYTSLENKKMILELDNDTLTRNFHELEESNEKLQKQLNEANGKVVILTKHLSQEKAAFQKEMATVNEQLKEEQSSSEQVQTALRNAYARMKKAEGEVTRLNNLIAQVHARYRHYKQMASDYQTELTELKKGHPRSPKLNTDIRRDTYLKPEPEECPITLSKDEGKRFTPLETLKESSSSSTSTLNSLETSSSTKRKSDEYSQSLDKGPPRKVRSEKGPPSKDECNQQ